MTDNLTGCCGVTNTLRRPRRSPPEKGRRRPTTMTPASSPRTRTKRWCRRLRSAVRRKRARQPSRFSRKPNRRPSLSRLKRPRCPRGDLASRAGNIKQTSCISSSVIQNYLLYCCVYFVSVLLYRNNTLLWSKFSLNLL